jgi:sucrose-6-phosphate hydrolase SacC (GH32 family)
VDGIYHLYFQHNEKAKVWGHAVSKDLLHWKQLPDAIKMKDRHQVYSGSCVIDHKNTSGFQKGKKPPIVAIFTSWGEGQCLAYSNDDGMTFKRYEGNPVLKLPGDELKSYPRSARDPHVMWDEERERWVMVLYANPKQINNKTSGGFSIFTSPDLKTWTFRSHLKGFYVCPDVFQLPIANQKGKKSWVAMDWEKYTTGAFDGSKFTPDAKIRMLDHGSNRSANQSWKHLPDGRVIQICWLWRKWGKWPGPWQQQMTFPVELTLRQIGDELVLCKNPIPEISKLHRNTREIKSFTLAEGETREIKDTSPSLDIEASFTLEPGAEIAFYVQEREIRVTRNSIRCSERKRHNAPLPGSPEKQNIRILVDRCSIEIFANDGSLTMCYSFIPKRFPKKISIKSVKGKTTFSRLVVHDVASMWER